MWDFWAGLTAEVATVRGMPNVSGAHSGVLTSLCCAAGHSTGRLRRRFWAPNQKTKERHRAAELVAGSVSLAGLLVVLVSRLLGSLYDVGKNILRYLGLTPRLFFGAHEVQPSVHCRANLNLP